MSGQIGILDGMKRGVALRCPTCGEGKLFDRYLKPTPHCAHCGADNTIYPSDDAPPYLTALLIGHLFVPVLLWIDRVADAPMWLTLSIALPLFAVMTLAALPFVKGAVIGFAHATGVTRASIGPATP